MKRFRGGLVFKAHKLVYHSTLGLRVIKKKKGTPDNTSPQDPAGCWFLWPCGGPWIRFSVVEAGFINSLDLWTSTVDRDV